MIDIQIYHYVPSRRYDTFTHQGQVVYMCHCIRSSLVTPLSEAMLVYWWLDPCENISLKFKTKYNNLIQENSVWNKRKLLVAQRRKVGSPGLLRQCAVRIQDNIHFCWYDISFDGKDLGSLKGPSRWVFRSPSWFIGRLGWPGNLLFYTLRKWIYKRLQNGSLTW